VRVACATQDIGTGTYTILAQVVSAKTGVPLDRISVVLGDTSLPPGPLSGGSMATASVIPAVTVACDQAIATLLFTATQIEGSIMMGIGMSLFEETRYDPHNGRLRRDSIAFAQTAPWIVD
jgi:xanthine dehydrogenase YagR molybdenum-binding subunit